MLLEQNPHQTEPRFRCVGFSMYACDFSVPQLQQFCLFTYAPRSKWAPSEKMIFFAKIGIFCKSIAGAISDAKSHWMINWPQFLNQLNFIWRHTKVFINYVSEMFICWERRWIVVDGAFCHSSNILGCTHCFWLFILWFIDDYTSFVTG